MFPRPTAIVAYNLLEEAMTLRMSFYGLQQKGPRMKGSLNKIRTQSFYFKS
jgi:hypothetical protein